MADTREKFTKKTDEAVKLIEEASAMDCSIKEICLYANISKQTYYNWIEKDKKLKDRIDELRATPFLLARTTVITGIKENYSNAMDYLKRKKKLEFGDNIDVSTLGESLQPVLVKFIDDKNKDDINTSGV